MLGDDGVAPVEDNIVFFVRRICDQGPDWVVDRSRPRVEAFSSQLEFPLFNLVAGASVDGLAADAVEELARSVVAEFTARRLPWMWWTTPTHTSPQLEDTLSSSGLEPECVPGMYADLEAIPDHEVAIKTHEVPVHDQGFGEVFINGFGLPEFILNPIQGLLDSFRTSEQVVMVASIQGRTVGVASGLITGNTIGIYNVATLPEHRGHGVGSSVTRAVMQEGKNRGCTSAILHTTPMGRGVYERLGFEAVCSTTHWTWMPEEGEVTRGIRHRLQQAR